MFHLASSQSSTRLAVSLWRGTELLGWFRANEFEDTGMLITGPIDMLADNSIVTVSIELKQQNAIMTHLAKALVIHPENNAVELWWADQHAYLPPLIAVTAPQLA